MSKARNRERLKTALEKAGSEWIFTYWGSDVDRRLDEINAGLAAFTDEYEGRFGERPDPFDLLEGNPQKGAAFFHMDTLTASTEMKIMAWRVLLGCEIAGVDFRYRAGDDPTLSVTLTPPQGDRKERYVGRRPDDFRVLRHFGTAGAGGKLLLQGFYSLQAT